MTPGRPPFDIRRAGHIEFRVTDLGRARSFYVDLLGFVEQDRDHDRIYLRGYEELEHHSLTLRRAGSAGVGHIAFRVASGEDLERIELLHRRNDLPARWVEGEEAGQGRALRVQDPSGLPVEFYSEMARADRLLQRFDLYRGAFVMRLDHFNCQVPDVSAAARWYQKELGFACSEYTESADDPPQLWAIWLHRKQNVHDIALMNGTGPRVHHAGFWVQDPWSVIRACDVLAAAGMTDRIERGPGRHGLSNALFLYLRDPDGNRIELYTGDYLIADPDWPPIRWSINDPRRATFWGHTPPTSWFEEASPVESTADGSLVPTRPPLLRDRPDFVT
ncbi:MAG: 3,4-dihydroxyphenylacetate 2,3-dioxygenase [Armatimonadota bacterium]|nr:3,4-dihydroxyphenylacetate 2,3-dioxygenase [Armatimonadota bacterium]MDR5697078.1 3,4-dihydroxyphenylacetate 2,3-dioxygenase [Armatimonadota bacterium]